MPGVRPAKAQFHIRLHTIRPTSLTPKLNSVCLVNVLKAFFLKAPLTDLNASEEVRSVRNYARRYKRYSKPLYPNLPSAAASPRRGPAADPCPSPPPGSCTRLHVGSCRSWCMLFGFRQLSWFRLSQDFTRPPQLIGNKKNNQQ